MPGTTPAVEMVMARALMAMPQVWSRRLVTTEPAGMIRRGK